MKTRPDPEDSYHRGALYSILETMLTELKRASGQLELLLKTYPAQKPDDLFDKLIQVECCRLRLQEELTYAMRHLNLLKPLDSPLFPPTPPQANPNPEEEKP